MAGSNRTLMTVVDSAKPTLDPFTMKVDSKGYDPDEIYIRSTDGHGHSENIQTRISPELAGEIAALVQSGLIPDYKTAQNFVRDAIVHRLHYVLEKLEEMGANTPDGMRRAITLEFQLSRVQAERAQLVNLQRTVEEMGQLCEEAHKAGDVEALDRALGQCEAMGDSVREPYAAKIKEIRKRWMVELRRMRTAAAK